MVCGLVGALVAVHGGSPAPGTGEAPTAFVRSATQNTLEQRAADLTVSGSFTADGRRVPVTGSGQVDLTSRLVTLTMDAGSLVEHEVVANGYLYVGETVDGQDVPFVVSGKHWIGEPVPVGSDAAGTSATDPVAELELAAAHGSTVRSLGTATIGGVTVSGYDIQPSRQLIQQKLDQYLAESGLTPEQQQQIAQEGRSFGPFDIKIWIDGSRLVRRASVALSLQSNGTTVNGDVDVDYTNYGTPVSITPPSPDDVVGLSQFLTQAQADASSTATA